MPFTLFAVMLAPPPLPQITMPLSESPEHKEFATATAKSG